MLIDRLELNKELRTSLKNDIASIAVENELSAASLPIKEGREVRAIFVVALTLKKKEIDYRLVEALAKQIKQKHICLLKYEEEGRLCLYYKKLYLKDWAKLDELALRIEGYDFDEVWEGFVRQIGLKEAASGSEQVGQAASISLQEQLQRQEQKEKLQQQIEQLQARARRENNPKKKFDLVQKSRQFIQKKETLDKESFESSKERHAKLAVGSAITFVVFLWDTHERSGTNEVSV